MRTSRRKRSNEVHLDAIFHALSDRTRRAMLRRLERGPTAIAELARPFRMTLPGASKHVRVLERAGLVSRSKRGREHVCSMEAAPLSEVEAWIAERRQFWEGTLDALAAYVVADRERKE